MRIGLTGPLGAGKSTVTKVWAALGAGVVEGDEMGRRALEQPDLIAQLRRRFGGDIQNLDGSINRRLLAERSFASASAQQELTRLTFPFLYRLAQMEMDRLAASHLVVVFDAALIYEWGVEKDFDYIVVVYAPEGELIARAAQRLGIHPEQAASRLKTQISPVQKAEAADYVIENRGSLSELEARAAEVFRIIQNRDYKPNTDHSFIQQ